MNLDDRVYEPLTTKEGWRRFVHDENTPPATKGPFDDDLELEARLSYHARLGIVATPTVRQITQAGRRMMLLNQHQVGARRGIIVTGPAATGKTTAITQLGKTHELGVRRRHPDRTGALPVVYVTVPPAATPRMLAIEFARFLGLPVTGRPNQIDVTNTVCSVLCDLRTDLVIVDEIHNLNLATRVGAETSDQLKYLAERIPATFVYAGIDVGSTDLFAGIRGRQIAGRFATIATTPFPYGTAQDRQQWQALVATLERALRLRRHRKGRLLELDGYLYDRTSGMIGSLSQLVRGTAIEAILDGSERITKTSLQRIELDHASEQHRKARADRRPHTQAG